MRIKTTLIILLLGGAAVIARGQSVGIGTNVPNSTAILDVQSTNKGMLTPRMSTTQRKAIAGPAAGLLVFDTDKELLYMYDGGKRLPFAAVEPEHIPPITRTPVGNEQQFSHFGSAVAISGDYAIVGAVGEDIGANEDQGAAYIFTRSGGNWGLPVRIFPGDGDAEDYFRASVDISGEYAVVGAPGHGTGGAVYIYKRTGTVWNQEAKITGGGANADFGQAVSIDGDKLVIGLPGNGLDNGGIQVYTRSGTTWNSSMGAISPNNQVGARFGSAVSIKGNYMIVGAPTEDVEGDINRGAAYVYVFNGNSWSFEKRLLSGIAEGDMTFGTSVDISNGYAVVGAPSQGTGNSGAFYLFQRVLLTLVTWDWEPVAPPLSPYVLINNMQRGSSVAFSGDTNEYLLIGVPGTDIGINHAAGVCFIYRKRTGETNWAIERAVISDPGHPGDALGRAVAADGNNVIIGVPRSYLSNRLQPKIMLLNLVQ
jgi:hypothetical protein